jgi:hypothetical protein
VLAVVLLFDKVYFVHYVLLMLSPLIVQYFTLRCRISVAKDNSYLGRLRSHLTSASLAQEVKLTLAHE